MHQTLGRDKGVGKTLPPCPVVSQTSSLPAKPRVPVIAFHTFVDR